MAIKNMNAPKTSATATKKNAPKTLGALTELKGRIIRMSFGDREDTDGSKQRYANIHFAVEHTNGDETEYYSVFLNGDIVGKLEQKAKEGSYIGGDIDVWGRVQTSENEKDGTKYTNRNVLIAKKSDLPEGTKSLSLVKPEYDYDLG